MIIRLLQTTALLLLLFLTAWIIFDFWFLTGLAPPLALRALHATGGSSGPLLGTLSDDRGDTCTYAVLFYFILLSDPAGRHTNHLLNHSRRAAVLMIHDLTSSTTCQLTIFVRSAFLQRELLQREGGNRGGRKIQPGHKFYHDADDNRRGEMHTYCRNPRKPGASHSWEGGRSLLTL